MAARREQSPISDPRVLAVLADLHRRAGRQLPGIIWHYVTQAVLGGDRNAENDFSYYRDKLIPIEPGQGALIYLLCRALGAKRVVEFGTSFGVSTLYLAAAVRDNGGGVVIGTELEPTKAKIARQNFEAAGLQSFIDLREGDAHQTLKDCGGPVDFMLVDGWPKFARPILEIVRPQLRPGAIVYCDNVGQFWKAFADYIAYVRDPANGFSSTLLPLRSGTELSVVVR